MTEINLICNIIIAGSMSAFIVFAFGRSNSRLYRLPVYEQYLVKAGLSLISAGAMFNAFTLSTPPWTEVLLNIGLALTFVWAAVFHYNHFVKKANEE
jgi:hypothetical protein